MITCIIPPLLHRAELCKWLSRCKLRKKGVPDGNICGYYYLQLDSYFFLLKGENHERKWYVWNFLIRRNIIIIPHQNNLFMVSLLLLEGRACCVSRLLFALYPKNLMH